MLKEMSLYNNLLDWDLVGGLSSPSPEEDVLGFSSSCIQPPVAGFEEPYANHGDSDLFAEWMDEKIDLSVLDGLAGQPGILDDLNVMVGDPVTLLDNLMDWSLELLGSGNENADIKKCDSFGRDILPSTGLSPPISPCSKVPDASVAVLSEIVQESLYRQNSNTESAPVIATTVIHSAELKNDNPAEYLDVEVHSPNPTEYLEVEFDSPNPTEYLEGEFDSPNPTEYLEGEFDNPSNTEMNSCNSLSPPLTPLSFMSNTNDYLKVDGCSFNTELDNCNSSTPPLTPISSVSSVENLDTGNATEANISSDVSHSCSSFVLDSPIQIYFKSSDDETNEASVMSVKDSGNTSLLAEVKAGIKSQSQIKRLRSRKKAVPTSDPPVPVEIQRKERKRVQNKDAATRYRDKKRKESQAVMDEELTLEKRNQELKSTVEKLANEISYLKGLLNEAKIRAQSRRKLSSNSSITV